MKYFVLSELEQRLNGDFSSESLEKAIELATDSDLRSTLTHLLQPNAYLFLSWMEQWLEVKEICVDGGTAMPFRDRMKLSEHTLFPQFQSFVSPFLFPSFLSQLKNGELNETFEYLVLLNKDDQVIIENEVFRLIEKDLNKLVALANQKGTTEEQLIAQIHDVVNEQTVRILNSFSKRSYHLLIQFVEVSLQILKSPACTFRLANWLINKLQELKLNPEHTEQLENVKTDLMEGNVQLKTRFVSTLKLKIKSWLVTICLALFLSLIVYFIIEKPWSELADPQEIELSSSLTEFSVKERKYIDSLVAAHQPATFEVQFESDDYYAQGRELMVDARIYNKNQTVESYFSNWEVFLKEDSIRTAETCKNLEKSNSRRIPDGFSELKSKKNGQLSYIWNDSEYAIHFLVFSDVVGGKAYFQELKKGEEMEFLLSPNDHLSVVAGNYSIPFNDQTNGLVFCHIDNATFSSLMHVYKVKKQPSFYSKIVITGTNAASFQVVDVNGNLDLIR